MSELWGHMIGVLIVFMIIAFVGMWVWLWQKRHKPLFDEMAEMPMRDMQDNKLKHDSEQSASVEENREKQP